LKLQVHNIEDDEDTTRLDVETQDANWKLEANRTDSKVRTKDNSEWRVQESEITKKSEGYRRAGEKRSYKGIRNHLRKRESNTQDIAWRKKAKGRDYKERKHEPF
jgi:uncharacterized membrane-anchored protein